MSEIRGIHRRVMNMVARGVVEQSDDEPGMQQLQVSLLRDEGKVKVERMQNYGFSSNPPVDTETLVVFIGGGRDHGVIVGTDDRASRFTGLEPGEVAVYSNEGDSIVFKRDNTIELHSDKNLVIKTGENFSLETKDGALKFENAIAVEAPDINFKGNLHVDGDIDATGSINAPQGNVGGGS
jgi:phage baseplate assembly protein V